MWIDLDAVDSQDMIHQDLDSTGKITEKIIIIPTFDLYSHEVGDDNGKNRVTMLAYKIRCAPKNLHVKKNYFAKFLQRILISTSFLID